MDPLRLHAVAARVVAWHNRHPLARRITVAQVHSVGYVALPYVTPGAADAPPLVAAGDAGGASLRERAVARARQQAEGMVAEPPPAAPAVAAPPATVQAAFSEDFIAPLKPRQVARWAARHGRVLAQTPVNGPLREIEADGLQPGHRPLTLYVLTAAIELGDVRHRVLLAGGDDPAVLGQRLVSPQRAAAVVLGPIATVAATVMALRMPWPQVGAGASLAALPAASAAAQHAPAPAPAASRPEHVEDPAPPAVQLHTVALVATPAASAGAHDAAAGELHAAAPAPAAPPQAEPGVAPRVELPPAPPLDVEPRLGRITLPALNLPINDEAKAAAREARLQRAGPAPAEVAASAAPALPVVAAAPLAVAPAPAPAPAPSPAPAARETGPAFALSTRVLRTRAEAEQIAAAMGSLLKGQPELRVEVLPQGDDWRVVSWPFPAAAQADKARALLAARGMRVAVVDF